jgi:hypothetical protein
MTAATTTALINAGLSIGAANLVDSRIPESSFAPPVTVASSRNLTAADNGQTLETTGAVTLTVPVGLGQPFNCRVTLGGALSVASDGTALLNGATTTLTRALATNPFIEIHGRLTANSYAVNGA